MLNIPNVPYNISSKTEIFHKLLTYSPMAKQLRAWPHLSVLRNSVTKFQVKNLVKSAKKHEILSKPLFASLKFKADFAKFNPHQRQITNVMEDVLLCGVLPVFLLLVYPSPSACRCRLTRKT